MFAFLNNILSLFLCLSVSHKLTHTNTQPLLFDSYFCQKTFHFTPHPVLHSCHDLTLCNPLDLVLMVSFTEAHRLEQTHSFMHHASKW